MEKRRKQRSFPMLPQEFPEAFKIFPNFFFRQTLRVFSAPMQVTFGVEAIHAEDLAEFKDADRFLAKEFNRQADLG